MQVAVNRPLFLSGVNLIEHIRFT